MILSSTKIPMDHPQAYCCRLTYFILNHAHYFQIIHLLKIQAHMHIIHNFTYVVFLDTEVSPSFFSQRSATKQKHAKTNYKIQDKRIL